MKILVLFIFLFCGVASNAAPQNFLNLMKLPPFERAVTITKYFEQWHSKKNYPYIGWGHRILPNEKLTYPITKQQADSILRSDLRKNCALFRQYGADSLLLGCISYNCGCASLLGSKTRPKSSLLKKLDAGNRNIVDDVLEFCHYKGKRHPYILRRRWLEYLLLYEK